MKKILLVTIFCFFVITINVNARVIKRRTGYAYYVNDVHQEMYMFEDYYTHLPVFRIQYETPIGSEWDYKETNSLSLTEEELKQAKKYINYITEGKSYGELDYRHLLGTQALIWEIWAKKVNVPLRYSFDVGFLQEFRKIIKEKEKEENNIAPYEYTTVLKEPLKVNFLPFFESDYQIVGEDNTVSIVKNGNEFVLTPNKVGDFSFEMSSDYFEEKSTYWASEYTELLELNKPKIPNSQILLHVKEPPKENYTLRTVLSEGVTLTPLQKQYIEGEEVTFSYQLLDHYQISDLKISTISGKEIPFSDNTFTMPKEDVILTLFAKKEEIKISPDFHIYVYPMEGIKTKMKLIGKEKEVIPLEYVIEDDYVLENITVTTFDGKNIDIKENSFIMPEQDVFIKIFAKKKLPPQKQEQEQETEEDKNLLQQEQEAEALSETFNKEEFHEKIEYSIPNTYQKKSLFSFITFLIGISLLIKKQKKFHFKKG